MKESEVWGHLVPLMEGQFVIIPLSAGELLILCASWALGNFGQVLKNLNIDWENDKILSLKTPFGLERKVGKTYASGG